MLVGTSAFGQIVPTTGVVDDSKPDLTSLATVIYVDSLIGIDIDFGTYNGIGNATSPLHDAIAYDPVGGNLVLCFDTFGNNQLHAFFSTDGGTTWIQSGGPDFDPEVGMQYGDPFNEVEEHGSIYGYGVFANENGPLFWYISKRATSSGTGYADHFNSYGSSFLNQGAWDDDGTGWYLAAATPRGVDDQNIEMWNGMMVDPEDEANVAVVTYDGFEFRGMGTATIQAINSSDWGETWSTPQTLLAEDMDSTTAGVDGYVMRLYNWWSQDGDADWDFWNNYGNTIFAQRGRYFSEDRVAWMAMAVKDVADTVVPDLPDSALNYATWSHVIFESTDGGTTYEEEWLPKTEPFFIGGDQTAGTHRLYAYYPNGEPFYDDAGDLHYFIMLRDTARKNIEDNNNREDVWDFKRSSGGVWTGTMVTDAVVGNLTEYDIGKSVTRPGEIYVVYTEDRDTLSGSTSAVYLKASEDNGNTWGQEVILYQDVAVNTTYISIAYQNDDKIRGLFHYNQGSTLDTLVFEPAADYIWYFETPAADVMDIAVGVGDEPVMLEDYRLDQNFPNPFNPATTIRFHIPKAVNVTLKVYNVLGQEVKTLINNEVRQGEIAALWDASNVASGMYFYTLTAGEFTQTKKMTLLK